MNGPPGGVNGASAKRSLLVLSHAMERAFDVVEESRGVGADRPGLVLAWFQRREYFDVEAHRYAALAAAGHTVIVGLAGAIDGLPPGITAVPFHESDERAADWLLVLVRGGYATALLARDARDLAVGELTLEASRLFNARWTFQRRVALDSAREQLDRLAADLPVRTLEVARGHLDSSDALPLTAVETQLSSAADFLLHSIDAGQRRAQRLRAELDSTQSMAEHDQLTGLKNRHYLERFLGSDEGPAELFVLLVDVDDLKTVNDVHGHAAGDAVLRAVAAALREHSRTNDVVIRWGGDEFLLLVPDSGDDLGLGVGQRLAEAVRARRAAAPWDHLSLSVSVGVCWTHRTRLPLEQLDAALATVKQTGKGHAALAQTQSLDSCASVPTPRGAPECL